jgi:hypothetical protein
MAPAVENAPVRGQHMQNKTKQNKTNKQTNKQTNNNTLNTW